MIEILNPPVEVLLRSGATGFATAIQRAGTEATSILGYAGIKPMEWTRDGRADVPSDDILKRANPHSGGWLERFPAV